MYPGLIERGATSIIRHICILDSSSMVGGGITGLLYNSSGISGHYWYPGLAAPTALTLETITTLGTYAAPTSNAHMRFKEYDATNLPGLYEVHFHNDWMSMANGRPEINIMLKGAANMVATPVKFPLMRPSGVLEITVNTADHTPTTTAFEADGITDATADAYKDCWVKVVSGNNLSEPKRVTASSIVTTRVRLTVDTLSAALSNGDRLILF